jgi:hypothetical protein
MKSTPRYPKSYSRMSPQALRAHLSKRRWAPALVEATIANVLEERRAARPALKKREHHARLWGYLIDPARSELRNVWRMLKLSLVNETPERTEALTAYSELLSYLVTRLEVERDATTEMPGTVAAERGLPNNGEHWVDWVPRKKVALIYDYFNRIPVTKGVRRKEPFPVTLDKATSAKRKATLIERTTREMEHVERVMAAELADTRLTDTHVFKHQEIGELRVLLSRMQAALHIIKQLPANALIPHTWHRIFETRTRPGAA